MSQAASLLHRTVAAREGAAPHPLLLLLHGRGADENDLLGLAPYVDPRCFVVSPRAPHPFEFGGHYWYEMQSPGSPDEASFRDSLERLASFVGELATAYPIDPARVFLLGFSQGAVMSNALLLTAPHLMAGAILLSGAQPPVEKLAVQAEALRGKPVFAAHGTFDGVLPLTRGRQVQETLSSLGLDLTYREYEMDHQIVGPELQDIDGWLKARLDGAGSPTSQ